MDFSRVRRPFRSLLSLLFVYPIVTFVVVLVLLFGVIFLAHKLRTPETAAPGREPEERAIQIFTVGLDTPLLPAQAEIKEAGILEIVAVAPGVVKRVLVAPGQSVRSFQQIVELTTDYGANAASIQAQIAAQNARLIEKTYKDNRHLIELQEDLAKAEAALPTAVAPKTQRKIADTNEDIQERNLKNSRTVARLNAALAVAQSAPLRPRTLVSGTITNLPVRVGDYVTPGTVLASLSTADHTGTLLEVRLPASMAALFNPEGQSMLKVDGATYPLTPRFFSPQEDTQGLITIQFVAPAGLGSSLTNHSFLSVSLALDREESGSIFVPIDSVFQGNQASNVLILTGEGVAESKPITIEKVVGNFALVSGLSTNDRVIIDRLTVVGEHVKPEGM